STFAPRSNKRIFLPDLVGNVDMIAGRSMPGNVLSTKREIAINAPVLPALTHASTLPAFNKLIATRMEESFLERKACDGDSSISTRWEACWMVNLELSKG